MYLASWIRVSWLCSSPGPCEARSTDCGRAGVAMSKKNKLSTRVKAHAFDLKREKEEQEKRAKRKEVKGRKMQVEKKIRKKSFKMKKGIKVKPSAADKLKVAQAMEIDD